MPYVSSTNKANWTFIMCCYKKKICFVKINLRFSICNTQIIVNNRILLAKLKRDCSIINTLILACI